MQTYVMIDGNRHGPYSPDEVRQYLATGQLQLQMQAWREGMADWQPLGNFPEFAPSSASPAPKPARSRTPLYASLAAGVVALCAVAGWVVLRGGQAKAGETPVLPSLTTSPISGHPDWPKTLAELNGWYAEPPAGQNAATVFIKGYDAMSEQVLTYSKNASLPYLGTASVPSTGTPVPAAMKTAIAGFMQKTAAAWDFFRQGSSLSQSRYPIDITQGEETRLPDVARAKQATQTAAIYALGYANAQHGKEAGESLLIGYTIGRSLEAEPVLFSQLVRVTCNTVMLDALGQTVNRVALPPETLTRLQEVIGPIVDREASGESFNRAVAGEMVLGMAFFEMSQANLQKALGMAPNDTNGLAQNVMIGHLWRTFLENAKADRQFYVESFDQYFAARKEPFPARLKAEEIWGPRVKEAKAKQFFISNGEIKGGGGAKEAADLARLRLAQTAVALEQFRAAGGNRYPGALAELSPKFLASVPEDPFDGQPLRYTKSGNGYSLKSIGPATTNDVLLKSLAFAVTNPPKPAAADP